MSYELLTSNACKYRTLICHVSSSHLMIVSIGFCVCLHIADALSRLPAVHDSEGCTITSESVQAICDFMIPKSYVESLAVSPEIVEENLAATDVGDLVDWT